MVNVTLTQARLIDQFNVGNNSMTERGYDKAFADAVFEQIEGFSEYGFPRLFHVHPASPEADAGVALPTHGGFTSRSRQLECAGSLVKQRRDGLRSSTTGRS